MNERTENLVVGLLLLVGGSLILYGVMDQPDRASFVDESGEELASITYETAVSDAEKRKGLMFRRNLEKNHGMIFVYNSEADRSFWMKNTLIPLDIIFLSSNRTIINIEKAYPEPNATDSELTRYRSEEPAQYVVEVNQNFTDRKGIEKGDRVEFTLSR